MGNGIPAKLPAPESKFNEADDVMQRLENAMLAQQKKDLTPEALSGAIEVAETRGFNKINTDLVKRAEGLLGLVQHKFAEARVEEYKTKWQWAEAAKDPEGELMYKLMEEKANDELKKSKRKKPVKFYNKPVTNKPTCILRVDGLIKSTTESMIRAALDTVPDPDWEDPKTKRKKKPSEEPEYRKCGNFERCHVVLDSLNNCTGTAYLEYPDEKQLERAMKCDGHVVDYDKLMSVAADYGVNKAPSIQGRNTISFSGSEGWVLPGEGLLFEELAGYYAGVERVKAAEEAEIEKKVAPKVPNRARGRGPPTPAKEEEKKVEEEVEKEPEGPPPPTVNFPTARRSEGGIMFTKHAILNDKLEKIGTVRTKPAPPDFALYSDSCGAHWERVKLDPGMFENDDAPHAVVCEGSGAATIGTLKEVTWRTQDRVTWTKFKPESLDATLPVKLDKNGKPRKRKPRAIKLSLATPIPTPPSAPSINKCVIFKVDSCLREVKACFLPGFKELRKSGLAPGKEKDLATIVDYINSVSALEGVNYFPSGVTLEKVNPWEGDLAAVSKLGGVGSIGVCSICSGMESNHEDCIKNFGIAAVGMGLPVLDKL
jgi:hypothetical protein